MNARFLTWSEGGSVTLTLAPGASLTHARGGQHEEGWWSEIVTWTHDGDSVLRVSDEDGRDCDGRTSSRTVTRCALSALRSREWEGERWPEWERVDVRQRDYSADAAGY